LVGNERPEQVEEYRIERLHQRHLPA
jgi:hypothetical protein